VERGRGPGHVGALAGDPPLEELLQDGEVLARLGELALEGLLQLLVLGDQSLDRLLGTMVGREGVSRAEERRG
jgi:hypothetical protein